jgi:hypothetical protein
MTQDEIIEIARQAGITVEAGGRSYEQLLRIINAFAELVAQHTLSNIDPSKFMSYQEGMEAGRLAEREACARMCELMWHEWLDSPEACELNVPDAEDCYRAIRARGQA